LSHGVPVFRNILRIVKKREFILKLSRSKRLVNAELAAAGGAILRRPGRLLTLVMHAASMFASHALAAILDSRRRLSKNAVGRGRVHWPALA
jgi:hypothetical protein